MAELPSFEEAGSAWMIERRAGPEDPHLLFNPFIGNAVIVRIAAARGFAKLLVNLSRGAVREVLALAQAARDFADDLAIGARMGRRGDGLVDFDDAALARGDDSFLLFLQAAGQHDVGMVGAFAEQEID